jgi:hypothetical protein
MMFFDWIGTNARRFFCFLVLGLGLIDEALFVSDKPRSLVSRTTATMTFFYDAPIKISPDKSLLTKCTTITLSA